MSNKKHSNPASGFHFLGMSQITKPRVMSFELAIANLWTKEADRCVFRSPEL